MTVYHLAGGDDLNREISAMELQTLATLGLVLVCEGCTAHLNMEGHQVFHPDVMQPGAVAEKVEDEIRAALNPKKH